MNAQFFNNSIINNTINEDQDEDVEITTHLKTTLTHSSSTPSSDIVPPPSPSPHQDNQPLSDIFNLGLIALEMKQINIPCLLISSIIIVCCMIACDLLYRVVMNNMIHGIVRKLSHGHWRFKFYKICLIYFHNYQKQF